MRTLSESEKYWRQLDDFHSLTDLKIAVSSHREPQITAGLRSVCWKIFLLFKTLDRASWPNRLTDSRTTYDSLRAHYLRAIQHPDEFESSVDPLSENEESPWVALRADENLRAEIFQDIERCMPDSVYFRQPATQNMMLDVLFVWCKMHPDIGYRQGMHEILAPLLWVVERDAVQVTGPGSQGSDNTLGHVLDSTYIEHDTFTMFSVIMQTAKSFYAPAESGSTTKDTPMLARSSRIFERYLPKADPALATHLVKLEIVPQIFLLRWIRLLFGREFPLDSVLNMWDALFAIDSTLELVDMISIAMLLRIRWQLVEADTNEAFALLLRYPEPDAPAYTFIKDALYLRDHLTPEGGAEIITRHGKQAPEIEAQPPSDIRIPSPSPTFSSSRTRHSVGPPRNFVSQQGAGLEALLQGAAKGVLERGSQWGVGKAIRDAVGEVRKNVEAIQTGAASGPSTPRSGGGREYRKPGQLAPTTVSNRPGLERIHSGNVIKRMEGLEKRNKGLAKMLESAVGELWDYHKERSEDGKENKEAIEALSLAIAKVQFVQVYLEDSSIPLPVDESTEQAATVNATASLASSRTLSSQVPERTSSAPPTPSAPHSRPSSSTTDTADQNALLSPHPASPSSQLQAPRPSSNLPSRARPHLTSSSFSWMLGQEASPSATFASGTAHTSFSADEKRRMKGKGFLFGEEEEDTGSPKEAKRGSVSGRGGAKSGNRKQVAESEVEEEVIDLKDVGKRGAVS